MTALISIQCFTNMAPSSGLHDTLNLGSYNGSNPIDPFFFPLVLETELRTNECYTNALPLSCIPSLQTDSL